VNQISVAGIFQVMTTKRLSDPSSALGLGLGLRHLTIQTHFTKREGCGELGVQGVSHRNAVS